ncbi:MAG: phosphopantetheine-binding protein [Bacteroidales bacterium]|nr:phosphopantetheine-binding protein [Bacteroidales bacterium]
MEQLKEQLKQHIIEALSLEDITPADIDNEAPLFGDGLGLDSIDALEIILILEKHYGIHIANAADARPIFKSINTLAEFVSANKK